MSRIRNSIFRSHPKSGLIFETKWKKMEIWKKSGNFGRTKWLARYSKLVNINFWVSTICRFLRSAKMRFFRKLLRQIIETKVRKTILVKIFSKFKIFAEKIEILAKDRNYYAFTTICLWYRLRVARTKIQVRFCKILPKSILLKHNLKIPSEIEDT